MTGKEELDRLVDAALADRKLTSKEMEVLVRKAEQLGIPEDEFLIELDAKKFLKKKQTRSESKNNLLAFLNRIIYHREAGLKWETVYSNPGTFSLKTKHAQVHVNDLKIRMWHIVIPVFSAILITLFIIIISWRPNYSNMIDKALIEYNIEQAYIYLSKESYPRFYSHQKILSVAVPYFIREVNPKGALNLILEYNFNYKFPIRDISDSETNFLFNLSNYNDEAYFFNGLLLQVANEFVSEGKLKSACEIIETNLRPFADEECKQSFEQIADKISFIRKNCINK